MTAARDHLPLEVSFVSEFEGGQRLFRFAGGEVERFAVAIEGTEPLQDTYCQMVVDGAMESLILDAPNHPVAQTMEVTEALGVKVYVGVPVQSRRPCKRFRSRPRSGARVAGQGRCPGGRCR